VDIEKRRIYMKARNATPKAKKRRKAYAALPENIARMREYGKERYKRPGVKERKRELSRILYKNPEKRVDRKAYLKANDEKPRYKNRRKRYDAKIENKRRAYIRLLKRVYNVTVEEFDAMLIEQNGCDAITGLPLTAAVMDHDHTTNKVRALLNRNTNVALGVFGDNPTWLRAAADYVEKYSCAS
jgi:hypothetical protein